MRAQILAVLIGVVALSACNAAPQTPEIPLCVLHKGLETAARVIRSKERASMIVAVLEGAADAVGCFTAEKPAK